MNQPASAPDVPGPVIGRVLSWTNEMPAVPGWYWVRNWQRSKPVIIRFVLCENKCSGTPTINPTSSHFSMFDKLQYAGPIAEPTD